ncbi:hypothetical protein CRU99_09615 [Malaciobacter mytili]|uniref:hypothetical protein n=1 Tax=Malaciobacter mytili TaxID=603050 RepID=UPI00100B1417|nr:hypothetical protein [Malaciobacter mytili]RXI41586.1 hypothetical protein CRU99_09615 [Malaciobacter mytili]
MKDITAEQIREHIINVVKNENEFLADRHIIEDYQNRISNGRGYDELDYIAKIFIDDMERHLLNIEKNNFDIMKIDLDRLVQYLEFNLNDVFSKYINHHLVEAITTKNYKAFGSGENIIEILNLNALISAIVTSLHIYNLVKEAEKMNNAKKRDAKKIKNAIETLLQYTNDEQVKYYLNTIEVQNRDITVSTILSCIFCNTYKIYEEMFLNKLNKSEVLDLTKDIMVRVFESEKDYRPYSEIEIIKYQGYKLRMFKNTKKKSNK